MATKTIATWEEFVTALTETIEENTTYYIENNIDISDSPIESTISCPANTTYRKTFTSVSTGYKNAVTINGITEYSLSVGVFNLRNANVTFQNIRFTNLQVASSLFYHSQSWESAMRLIISNCEFNGRCGKLIYNYKPGSSGGGTYAASTVLQNCSIYLSGSNLSTYSGAYTYATIFSGCWIHFDKTGTTSSSFGNAIFLSNCYIEGSVTTSSFSSLFSSYGFKNCVFNIDVTLTGTTPSNAYIGNDGISIGSNYSYGNSYYKGTVYCLYNHDKWQVGKDADDSNITALTDSQLKSVSAIRDAAPNFPLYG